MDLAGQQMPQPMAQVLRRLEALEAEGIDPKEISMGALSHYNLYEYCFSKGSGASQVLLDLGHQHSTLSILNDDGPSIVRDMSVGGLSITRAIAAAFQLDPAEAEQLKVAEASLGAAPSEQAGRASMIDEACRRALTPLVTELRRTLASHEMRTGEDLDWKIKGLKETQAALKAERKRVKTTLENAERRRSRLRKRAKLLTDADLVEVLMMRGMEKDEVDKQVEEARSSRDTR